MKKFLGLPIFREPLTDAQCVERARKNLERFQRYGVWLLPLHLAPLLIYAFILDAIVRVLWRLGGNLGGLLGGIALGIILGLPVGLALYHFAEHFGQVAGFSKGDRSLELLVKYHDMLADLAQAEKESLAENRAGQGGVIPDC